MSDCAEVKVGQIWADNDKRVADRFLEVIAIDNGKAICLPKNGGRKTFISLTRMRPTHNGYRLVKNA